MGNDDSEEASSNRTEGGRTRRETGRAVRAESDQEAVRQDSEPIGIEAGRHLGTEATLLTEATFLCTNVSNNVGRTDDEAVIDRRVETCAAETAAEAATGGVAEAACTAESAREAHEAGEADHRTECHGKGQASS